MNTVLIYHNGECSKCKETTELLQSKGYEIEYRFYLLQPPGVVELRQVLAKLHTVAINIIRTSEPLFLEKYEGKNLNDDEWLHAIAENPILLQRPIAINGDKAIIARPPEKVLEIL